MLPWCRTPPWAGRRPAAAQHAQELVAVHLRHVPVEQHRVGHLRTAGVERLLAVLGLDALDIHSFEDPPCHLSNDARIINHQADLHDTLVLSTGSAPLDNSFSTIAFRALHSLDALTSMAGGRSRRLCARG